MYIYLYIGACAHSAHLALPYMFFFSAFPAGAKMATERYMYTETHTSYMNECNSKTNTSQLCTWAQYWIINLHVCREHTYLQLATQSCETPSHTIDFMKKQRKP